MAVIKRSMTVMDMRDEFRQPKDQSFRVTKMVNMIGYKIGQGLSEGQIDSIIRDGTQVTIVPYKK